MQSVPVLPADAAQSNRAIVSVHSNHFWFIIILSNKPESTITHRPDETWHRLLHWTSGQAPSERLAAQQNHATAITLLEHAIPMIESFVLPNTTYQDWYNGMQATLLTYQTRTTPSTS